MGYKLDKIQFCSISRLRDSDNSGVTFTDLEIHLLEEICGKYMDEYSFSRSYKSIKLSSDEVENKLGFGYLINRYRLAANGEDPEKAYFTDPIDFERKIINERRKIADNLDDAFTLMRFKIFLLRNILNLLRWLTVYPQTLGRGTILAVVPVNF